MSNIEYDTRTDSVKFLVEEFFDYSLDGRLIGSRRIFGNRHFMAQSFTEDDIKLYEQYDNSLIGLYYEIVYDENGNKKYQIVANKASKVITEYNLETGRIQKIIETRPYHYTFDSLVIKSSDNQKIAVEKQMIDSNFFKQDLEIIFFENGHLKSKKQYIYKPFDIYDITIKRHEEYNLQEMKSIKSIDKIRTGIWKFYDSSGQLEKQEDYNQLTFRSIF